MACDVFETECRKAGAQGQGTKTWIPVQLGAWACEQEEEGLWLCCRHCWALPADLGVIVS